MEYIDPGRNLRCTDARMELNFRLNMLKGMFEQVDDLCSKPSQCENKIELEVKYVHVYLRRSVEHIIMLP